MDPLRPVLRLNLPDRADAKAPLGKAAGARAPSFPRLLVSKARIA